MPDASLALIDRPAQHPPRGGSLRMMEQVITPTAWRIGRGSAAVAQVRGRSVCVHDQATSPLKLMCPDQGGATAWVYASTFGGGLVAGDRVELEMAVGEGATAVLTTQASTKVYHQQDGRGAQQHLRARVETGGLLVCAPDPLTCFADAMYDQTQRFDLAADASLVLVDWFTAGRIAMGESWAFSHYHSRSDVMIGGRLVAREAVRLDRADGLLDHALRTGGCHCLATVLLVGPACAQVADGWCDAVAAMPLSQSVAMRISASRWPWGAALRIAGGRTADVAAMLQERLAFLVPHLGRGVWERKW